MANEPDDEDRIDLYQDTPGRCYSCGFLGAVRLPKASQAAGSMETYEVFWGAREQGSLFKVDIGTKMPVKTFPFCARLVPEFMDDLKEALENEPNRDSDEGGRRAARAVLSKDRHCDSWQQYEPYRTPKEHLEETRMLEQEKMRQENAQALAELQRRSQESLKEVMEAHKEISQAANEMSERAQRENSWYQRAFMLLAAIALVLALVPLAYPDGIAWLVENAPLG